MNDSLIVNSLYFLLYLFIAAVLYFVLGGPIDTIFDSFTSNPAVPQQATLIPYYKTAVRIAFAIGVTTPVFWYVAKMFSREPTYYKYKRY